MRLYSLSAMQRECKTVLSCLVFLDKQLDQNYVPLGWAAG